MSTVDDVATELGLPTGDVLEACRTLDIVASSGASGLSSAEHRRLRATLHGHSALPPVVAGSTDPAPRAAPAPDPRTLQARAAELRDRRRTPRLSPRTVTRIAVYAFLLVAVIVAVVSLRDRAEGDDPGVRAFVEDDEGTCVDLDGGSGARVTTMPCEGPHDAELYAVVAVGDRELAGGPDDAYPGSEAVVAEAEAVCGNRFADYVGRPDGESSLDVVFLVPTAVTWELGDRTLVCLVEDPSAALIGSVAGTGR